MTCCYRCCMFVLRLVLSAAAIIQTRRSWNRLGYPTSFMGPTIPDNSGKYRRRLVVVCIGVRLISARSVFLVASLIPSCYVGILSRFLSHPLKKRREEDAQGQPPRYQRMPLFFSSFSELVPTVGKNGGFVWLHKLV